MHDVVDIDQENVLLREKVRSQAQRISQLESLLKQLRQQRFGASSEKLSVDQIQLFDEAEAIEGEEAQEQTSIYAT